MLHLIKMNTNLVQDSVMGFGNKVKTKDITSVYYLMNFLMDFSGSLVATTYVLFLMSRGLDLFQVMLVNFAFMAANFIFEIPTGAYADFFGRRNSVIVSSIFLGLAHLIYFNAINFPMFVLAEIAAAIHLSCLSGAMDAWMVDQLDKKGFKGNVDIIFSHSEIFSRMAALIGGLIGAYIGSVNLALPFAVGAAIAVVGVVISVFFMHEDFVRQSKLNLIEGLKQMGYVAQNSIEYGFRHKVIFWLIIASIVSSFAFMPLNMYWSPRMNALAGNQVWILGWVWTGLSLSMMLGSYLVKKLLHMEKSYSWIMIATTLVLGVPIILAASSNIFGVVLVGFLTYEIGRGMISPAEKAYLNRYIPSEQRATVLSFDSMMGKLGAALGLLVLGYVGKNYSIEASWMISGVLLLTLVPIYLRTAKHEKILAGRE